MSPADELAKKPYDRARLDVVAGSKIEGRAILELGGGSAQAGRYLEKLGCVVIGAGASASDEMSKLARARSSEVELRAMRFEELAFKDGELGGAVAMSAFIDLGAHELGAALREVARVLAPKAPLLFTVFRREPGMPAEAAMTLWDRKELAALIESLGVFDLVRVESRRPYPAETPAHLHRIFTTARRA